MRTLDCQHKFYLVNNHGILEAHTSEDDYVIPTKNWFMQIIELLFW